MQKFTANHPFCKGIAIAKPFVIEPLEMKARRSFCDDPESEVQKFHISVKQAAEQISQLADTGNLIFLSHLELVNDHVFHNDVIKKILSEHKSAEWALEETVVNLVSEFASLDYDYMRERAIDIKDVGMRIFSCLRKATHRPFEDIQESVIVVAKELTPSDTADMDFSHIKGFITEEGGITSHVAIIAKTMGIPAIVGVPEIMNAARSGRLIVMDAEKGEITIDPDPATLRQYEALWESFAQMRAKQNENARRPSVSADGHSIRVCTNVGSLEELKHALDYAPDGIGLFRTEFMYMQRTRLPSEDEQFEIYKDAVCLMNGRELTFRTLDIGADKNLPYLDLGKEENPALGYRAIRVCLDRPQLFKAQLKALLRASAFGQLQIMYPMISSLEELDAANQILAECKQELQNQSIAFDPAIRVGMMVENPAAVILADAFAPKVSFFSIGSNDLTQYILSIDRGNQKVASMYNTFHPAILRCIAHIIAAGHRAGISVGMCGEFASDRSAFRLLLGMGLDEFSMAPPVIPDIKELLWTSEYEKAKNYASQILAIDSVDGIKKLL